MESLALKLLSRGDTLSIENGHLRIESASGKPVPPEWMDAHAAQLCREVLISVGLDAFEYLSYSTGHYGKNRSGGITLSFVSVVTGQSAYAIFNADLTRQRNTATGKSGALLPKGQFRVGKRSHFYKLWFGTGLQMPDRMQRFHKCMGKLSGILFAGTLSNDRFDTQSIRPITLTAERVRTAILGHKEGTTWTQAGHKQDTRAGHKETPRDLEQRAFQPISTTCAANYENKLIRSNVHTCPPSQPYKPPVDQSVDEWLEDYDADLHRACT